VSAITDEDRKTVIARRWPVAADILLVLNNSFVGARLKCHWLRKVEITPHWSRVGRRSGAKPQRSARLAPDFPE
jgi:hypothetical protein